MAYKLASDDIWGMLRDASRVLTKEHDRELTRRLHESMRHTDPSEWDKGLIATLLAKAGKMHEAEMVAYDMEVRWKRADALRRMAVTLLETGERAQALGLLHAAANAAIEGQAAKNSQDVLDASAVLGEVAATYAEHGEMQIAQELVEQITDPTRKLRAEEMLAQFESPKTESEEQAAS